MRTLKAFEVVEMERICKNECIVRGRAYVDVFIGDSVFVIANGDDQENKTTEFKVIKISTYRREVPVLNGMVTGELTLLGDANETLENANMIYKI